MNFLFYIREEGEELIFIIQFTLYDAFFLYTWNLVSHIGIFFYFNIFYFFNNAKE